MKLFNIKLNSPLKAHKAPGPRTTLRSSRVQVRLPFINQHSKTPPIKGRLNQTIQLPELQTYRTPVKSRNSSVPQRSKNFSFESSALTVAPTESKQMINLEKIQALEGKLGLVNEKVKRGEELGPLLEEYWRESEDQHLWNIEKLFREASTRKSIRKAMIIEAASICLINFGYRAHQASKNQMKNLTFYLHQNFLNVIQFILSRLPAEVSANSWVNTLQNMLRVKRSKTVKKSEILHLMQQYTDMIYNIIRATTKSSAIDRIFTINLLNVLANMEKLTISTARIHLGRLFSPYKTNQGLKLLPDVADSVLTLVLDLDQTLVHYNNTELLIRPFVAQFLESLSKHYELVIFTAGLQDYADWAIDIIDQKKLISYRLYRHHAIQAGPTFIKDLRRIGRPLQRVLIVDNMPMNFQLQQDNGIAIQSWIGDPEDRTLISLGEFLIGIAESGHMDIREALKEARQNLQS